MAMWINMDNIEAVKAVFDSWDAAYDEMGGNTLAVTLPDNRMFFVMCVGDVIELGLCRPDFYKRMDARRMTLAGRKAAAKHPHIDFNGSGREPMFGAALESDSTTSVPEMSVAMKGLLKDMVEAMDEFDKALRIK